MNTLNKVCYIAAVCTGLFGIIEGMLAGDMQKMTLGVAFLTWVEVMSNGKRQQGDRDKS